MSRVRFNGGVIGQDVAISQNAASGMFDLASQTYYQEKNLWPLEPFEPTATTTLVEDATPQLINIYGERNTSSNVLSNYRVLEISFTPSSNGSKTFYIGYRIPLGTGISTFYHDYTIAGVQLAQGGSVLETYRNTTWTGFQTTSTNSSISLTTLPTTNSFINIATGTTAARFNIDTNGTGSSRTGMRNGISTNTFPAGGGSMGQTSGAAYLYVETSGATGGMRVWARKTFSTTFSTSNTYTIKVAHYLNTTSQYTTDASAFQQVSAIYIT